MIQIIDETSNTLTTTAAERVIRELVAWSMSSTRRGQEEEDEQEIVPKKMLKDWLNQLEATTTELSHLVNLYGDTIRGFLFEGNRLVLRGIPILECYGTLVSSFGQQQQTVEATATETETKTQSEHELLTRVLKLISKDILTLTKPPSHNHDDEEDDSHDRCRLLRSIVLPTMMRIMETILLAPQCQLDRSILTRITALLLSFETDQLDSLVLHPSLDRIDIMKDCVLPLKEPYTMAWDVVRLDASTWKDEVVVLASRRCWNALAKHIGIPTLPDDNLVPRIVCAELGWEACAKAVRTQFFGKEDEILLSRPWTTRPPLTYPLKIATTLATEPPPHRREHARIHAALLFVRILESPSSRSGGSSSSVLGDMLPVCLALMDSSVASLVAMGCAALMVLLDKCPNDSDDWREYKDSVISVLDMTVKGSADPLSVGFVCLACSKAFEILDHEWKDRRRRLMIVRFLDLIMYRMRNQSDENGMVVRNILIGGLIPLFQQQCANKNNNAEAMELGRRGLQVFLPLLRWDDDDAHGRSGKKVQVAALVALINLMYAAYPIMPHHGEKIICELVACWAHCHGIKEDTRGDDNDDHDDELDLCGLLLHLADHATMVALVLCGESATRTLSEIQKLPLDPVVVKYATCALEKSKSLFQDQEHTP